MADKNLFLKNYNFYGKHCDMVLALTKKIDEESQACVFNKTIDLFICAALVGVKNSHKSKPSLDKTRQTNIFAEQFNTHSHEISIVFKLVTLLGNSNEYDEVTRLNKTFRNPETDENYAQFEEYMLGGLEDIYNSLMLDTNKTYNDYLNSLLKFLNQFNKSDEDEIDPEAIPDSNGLFD